MNQKNSKVPTLLMVAPLVIVVMSMVLAWVAGLATASMTPPVDPNSELFGEQPFMVKVLNVLMFLLGAVGVIGFIAIVPCFIAGFVMFVRAKSRRV
jgi:hypothetical protein